MPSAREPPALMRMALRLTGLRCAVLSGITSGH